VIKETKSRLCNWPKFGLGEKRDAKGGKMLPVLDMIQAGRRAAVFHFRVLYISGAEEPNLNYTGPYQAKSRTTTKTPRIAVAKVFRCISTDYGTKAG
jgi:hypothetical protein